MRYPPVGKQEYVSGNLYIRQMWFERAGDAIRGHAHNFDHTTYVVRGAIRIETLALDLETVVSSRELHAAQGEAWFLIPKQDRHRITALADDTLAHCIYSHRAPNGDVIQEYAGNIVGTM